MSHFQFWDLGFPALTEEMILSNRTELNGWYFKAPHVQLMISSVNNSLFLPDAPSLVHFNKGKIENPGPDNLSPDFPSLIVLLNNFYSNSEIRTCYHAMCFKDGYLHNNNGPAGFKFLDNECKWQNDQPIINKSDEQEFWYYGDYLSRSDYNQLIKKHRLKYLISQVK